MHLTRVFIDESGDISSSNTYLIGAVVIPKDHKELIRVIESTRRKFPKLKKTVLHAADDPPEAVKFLLAQLQGYEQLRLTVGVFNQDDWWWNREAGNDHAYGLVIAETIRQSLLVAQIGLHQVEVVIERRYTNRRQNESLQRLISEHLDIELGQVLLDTKKKTKSAGWSDHLSVADYIAWSYYQLYSKGDDQFARIINDRVAVNCLKIDGEGSVGVI